jgi:hypothetical protein
MGTVVTADNARARPQTVQAHRTCVAARPRRVLIARRSARAHPRRIHRRRFERFVDPRQSREPQSLDRRLDRRQQRRQARYRPVDPLAGRRDREARFAARGRPNRTGRHRSRNAGSWLCAAPALTAARTLATRAARAAMAAEVTFGRIPRDGFRAGSQQRPAGDQGARRQTAQRRSKRSVVSAREAHGASTSEAAAPRSLCSRLYDAAGRTRIVILGRPARAVKHLTCS